MNFSLIFSHKHREISVRYVLSEIEELSSKLSYPILFIHRENSNFNPKNFLIKTDNILLYYVEDGWKDDFFSIYAALNSVPNTYLLSK